MSIKTISSVSSSRSVITIRSFKTPDDVPYIERWVGVEAAACLTSMYESVQLADFVESLMVLNNNEPLFQADLCKAPFDEISAAFSIKPGDYTLRLLMPFQPDNKLFQRGLLHILNYGFIKKNATRLLVPVYESNKMLNKWFQQAGCTMAAGFTYKQLFGLYILPQTAFQTLDQYQT
jgi:hypothetical protein